MRSKKLLLTLITLGILSAGGLATAPAAGAAPSDPTQQLQELCERRHGDFFVTPYQKARCQHAKPSQRDRTFSTERKICEESLAGTFSVVSSFTRPNRVTWACS
jgi:hypothetical protein